MIDKNDIQHHIQRHIMAVLTYKEYARFSEMRPKGIDSNAYSYHLTKLLKNEIILKNGAQYTLSQTGLTYVDRVSADSKKVRTQPKIITMLVVQNGNGDILLQQRNKQPYINQWTLPYGKLHIDDNSVKAAAERELHEKLGIESTKLVHAGDCYIRVKDDASILTSTLAHIFKFYSDDIAESDTVQWVRPHKLMNYSLAPAVEQIVARTFFNDPFFFEEFEVDLSTI